ncbi:MAG: hypothetical protein PHQ75_15355, partial [Thermoguttaceae bacterium]|nr:hypothetical protein [Thermoguttaceae bacterium]
QSIRKYYLEQRVARRLATRNITKVLFDKTSQGENIHRQKISWSDGSVVIANRGTTDFATNGYRLPRYSYIVLDENGKLLSGIFRNPQFPQAVVEASDRGHSFYMNARCYSQSAGYRIEPKMVEFEQVSNKGFKIKIDWHAKDALPTDAHVFVHLFKPDNDYRSTGWYPGGESPNPPTSKWGTKTDTYDATIVRTGEKQIMTVPDNMPAGKYQVLAGIYDAKKGGGRFAIQGNAVSDLRYSIATVLIERSGNTVKLTASAPEVVSIDKLDEPQAVERAVGNDKPFTWRGMTTTGAVLVTPQDNVWSILPIPVLKQFDITLDEESIGRKIVSVESHGQNVKFRRDGNKITFAVTAENAQTWQVSFK